MKKNLIEIPVRKKVGRKRKAMKIDNRVTTYFDENTINRIELYGHEIGSLNKSNTVRSIVTRFLNNHDTECQTATACSAF
ncbi:MAG: hypothetical protein JXB48_11115 [Candidatus Latescibacteria bacterium]|nr:hypothetical protein [Candidatus Latescibacterota bacterium]